ncbi:MAG TPA: rod shape-determining protein MreC [Alphaproteobacteria bacterium]|nr:rod shape-determining protein MreC [Alphaproteobacteria bacterium]
MKPRGSPIMRYAAPLKAAAQRFAFLMLIAGAVGLIILGKADAILVERLRVAVSDAFAPILAALARPIATVDNAIDEVRALVALRAENERLRQDNAELRNWEQVARELGAQNRALSAALKFVPRGEERSITGRVIADSGGAFVRSLLIDAGARDGVAKGQAVVVGQGLIGRIAEVGEVSARALLITDLNSRIPVVVETTRDHAILAGDNTDLPRLLYLPPNLALQPGTRIVTSGDGGAFPPGLPIGTIASVGEGGPRVQPFANWSRVEYVRIIDYGLKGILGPLEPAPAQPRGKHAVHQ